MLANYNFKGGIPKKLGDPGVKIALCDLGASVSVMPLSLYIVDLN